MKLNSREILIYEIYKDKVIFSFHNKNKKLEILNNQEEIKGKDIYEFLNFIDRKKVIELKPINDYLEPKKINSLAIHFIGIIKIIVEAWNASVNLNQNVGVFLIEKASQYKTYKHFNILV